MNDDWVRSARAELIRRRTPQGGWGYRTDARPAVEPTVLAGLGLRSLPIETRGGGEEDVGLGAADWLASEQQPDGSLRIDPGLPQVGWPTAYGLLLWNALGSHGPARGRAVAWLLAERGRALRNGYGDRGSIVGHDPTLIGWPWIDGTHSWLEPTALAILALSLEGLGSHPRVVEGVRLVFDRSLPHGGWNYGNRAVFGSELRPQPGPTGLALVSLASCPGPERNLAVDSALAYLRQILPRIHAPLSLGWGVLGLKAWDACPAEADAWLAGAFAMHAPRRDATAGIGLLALARAPRSTLHRAADPFGSSIAMNRRSFVTCAGAVAATGMGLKLTRDLDESGLRARVFIARASSYEQDLEPVIRAGLVELGLGPQSVRGKRVLLKPNLVEPTHEQPQINTHPAVVRAAAEVFRRWHASDVMVAEGQGHCRDSQYVLGESGLGRVLGEAGLEFVDLNHDDVDAVPNTLRFTQLTELFLPRAVRHADLIVSLPKMKTHHWAGVTLSMKNLFGVMPGVCYGWPKNVLHFAGIPQAILDINAAVRPHLAIVDGIIGMEGDGPIMGTPRTAGLIVMGTNFPAVDATCARLMGINPWKIGFLMGSSGRLGPIAESHIEQRGELIAPNIQPFRLLDHPSLAALRA